MSLKNTLYFTVFSILVFIGCSNYPIHTDEALSELNSKSDFELLEGKPLVLKYGNVQGVKVVYDLFTEELYFVNGKVFKFHSDFCTRFLKWKGSHEKFNQENYSNHKNQQFILANINYYDALDKYVLEFSVANEISKEQIKELYQSIANSVFFKDEFYLLLNNKNTETLNKSLGLKSISIQEVYKNQTYQPLHKTASAGKLKFIDKDHVLNSGVESTDIIVVNGSPNVLPVSNGIITTELQGPLSHITLLGINRGIPIMRIENAWEDSLLRSLEGEYVALDVQQDRFVIEKISKSEYEFSTFRKHSKVSVRKNVKFAELIDVKDLKKEMIHKVGGKAASFGELSKLNFKGRAKTPEGAFAIPFYYYDQHMINSGAQFLLDSLLLTIKQKGAVDLTVKLNEIRNTIIGFELDQKLLVKVEQKILNSMGEVKMRFRSSTNAEDIDGFNGAGLYESKSGKPNSKKKPVDVAIKKVWASLWLERAFQERSIFGIDQRDVAMGILVHRAFPNEIANGVAITSNLYRTNYPGYTVSVQLGEESVVSPKEGVVADHYIAFTNSEIGFTNQNVSIDWVSRSNISKVKSVLSDDEIENLMKSLSIIKNGFYTKSVYFDGISYYDFALDVEFKIVGENRELYIKQVRRFNKPF